MSSRDVQLTALFDLLVRSSPQGVTILDIMDDLGVGKRVADALVHDLRMLMESDPDVNLVSEPQDGDTRWSYSLVGTVDGASFWVGNRLGDAETRLRTLIAVMAPIVASTDGRTLDGRRARIMHRAATRALEDLADLSSSV